MPTTDVDDRGIAAEVVAGRHSNIGQRRNTGHGAVEEFGMPGNVGEIFEALLAVQYRDDGLSAPDRVHQQSPPFALLTRSVELRRPSHRRLLSRTQCSGKGIQLVAAIASMTKDAPPDQGA